MADAAAATPDPAAAAPLPSSPRRGGPPPSGAAAISPFSLPRLTRAVRPDPAVRKLDPEAGRRRRICDGCSGDRSRIWRWGGRICDDGGGSATAVAAAQTRGAGLDLGPVGLGWVFHFFVFYWFNHGGHQTASVNT